MKKLLFLILFISLSFLGHSQYNITQNLGGPTTLVQNPNYGGFRGGLIPYTFSDTTSANSLASLLKLYNGALIYCTADNAVYWRDATNQKWVQLLPSGGTGGLSAWLTTGNFAVPTDVNGYAKFGTFGTNGINVITSGNTVFKIHADGIVPDTGTVQGLGVNSYGELSYFSGGGGATPTWQQTLTAGSTLTGNNTIAGGGFDFTWDNMLSFTVNDASNDRLVIDGTQSILFSPNNTRYFNITNSTTGIFGLANLSTQDRLIGQRSTTSEIGYITIGSGLSLSSGVLSNSGVVTTPTWQQTLTAGSTLNISNNINSGNNTQSFSWPTLGGGNVGMYISSESSTAATGGEILLQVTTTHTPVATGITTYSADIQNSSLGTNLTNISLMAGATEGATNIAAWFNRGKVRFGTSGTESGILDIVGATSGTITFQPQSAAGTYNWNWPTTAGTSGYLLTSGGGGSTAMTWTNPASFGMAIGNTVTSATAGSIFFAGTGGTLQQKNSTLFFDSTNIELGLGTNSPASLFNAIAGVCDFRFSKGLADVTPSMTVINTSGMAGGLIAGTSGSAFVYDNAGPFYLISESHSAFVNNTLGGGTIRMTLTATGELGINTTSPAEKLEVAGNAKVSGKFIGRNIIYQTLNASDADFTAAVGTAYVLPDAATTARTVTLPAGQDGDIIRFHLPLTPSNHWTFSTAVTLPDGSTYTNIDTYTNSVTTIQYDGANSVWRAVVNL